MYTVYATRDQLYFIVEPGEDYPESYGYAEELGTYRTKRGAENALKKFVHTSYACSDICIRAGFCSRNPARCKDRQWRLEFERD